MLPNYTIKVLKINPVRSEEGCGELPESHNISSDGADKSDNNNVNGFLDSTYPCGVSGYLCGVPSGGLHAISDVSIGFLLVFLQLFQHLPYILSPFINAC